MLSHGRPNKFQGWDSNDQMPNNDSCLQDDNFRLYLVSKLPNPAYGPEISGKTMIINYSVTEQGLQAQLLNATVSMSAFLRLSSTKKICLH
jgi:hypothetical protein